MGRSERKAAEAQKESDHHRWADDGGFTPDPEAPATPVVRTLWLAVAAAAGLGFALGWLRGRR